VVGRKKKGERHEGGGGILLPPQVAMRSGHYGREEKGRGETFIAPVSPPGGMKGRFRNAKRIKKERLSGVVLTWWGHKKKGGRRGGGGVNLTPHLL